MSHIFTMLFSRTKDSSPNENHVKILDLENRENTLSFLNAVLISATLLLTISADVANSVTKGELVEANNVCSNEDPDRQFWSAISVSICVESTITIWSIILVAVYSTTETKYLKTFSNSLHGFLFMLLLVSVFSFWMIGQAFSYKVCYIVEDQSRYDDFSNPLYIFSTLCAIGMFYLVYKYYRLIYVPSRMEETIVSADNNT